MKNPIGPRKKKTTPIRTNPTIAAARLRPGEFYGTKTIFRLKINRDFIASRFIQRKSEKPAPPQHPPVGEDAEQTEQA